MRVALSISHADSVHARRQAKVLQNGLLALLDRVDHAKAEYDKLEGENRFLQS